MEQPLKKNVRIEAVETLRGVAVMAIILVHNLEHFIFPAHPTNFPSWLKALGLGVPGSVFNLFPVKSYAVFALPAGFVSYIRANHRKMAIAIFFLLQSVGWYHYISRQINPACGLPDLEAEEMYEEVAVYACSCSGILL